MKNKFILTLLLMSFMFIVQGQSNANLSDSNKELLQELNAFESQRQNRIESYLQNNPNVKRFKTNSLNQFLAIHDIINGKPIYRATDNLEAARATKVTHLQVGGSLALDLDGTGMTVGVWDGGPAEDTHPEFANANNSGSRITNVDNTTVDGDSGFSSHGTHVTGTIAAKGANPNALGMAPNVNIKSYNWTNDSSEMVLAVNDATNPIILSNHSYGTPIDQGGGNQLDAWFIGAYTQGAQQIDNISRNNPGYLVIASAGNNGTTTYSGGLYAGYDKLTGDKNAKNNLVIANANPTLAPFTYEIQSLFINSGSSQGPTDDLRIKPDIAADGTNLFSPTPGNTYSTFSGTSMSAPNTTGALVLLQQYYNQLHGSYMNSSTLKGLVCHTAVDDATIGPDPKFGWGFLDAKASAETIAADNNNQALIDELTLDNNQVYSYTFYAEAGEKLSATICWTDMPGPVVSNGSLNNQTPRLINDLDLRISKDGTTYFPWKLDYSSSTGFSNSKGDNFRDNIERIDIDVPESGDYTLTVSHKGVLQGNTGGPFDPQSQDFSLILTGNNLTLSIEDDILKNSFAIYPNPSKGEFNISFNLINQENVNITVYDISGRSVFERLYNDIGKFNEVLNLNSLQSGVYLLDINSGDSRITRKIIIN